MTGTNPRCYVALYWMKGIGHSGDETNFMQQLQHDFMICCVIEIF